MRDAVTSYCKMIPEMADEFVDNMVKTLCGRIHCSRTKSQSDLGSPIMKATSKFQVNPTSYLVEIEQKPQSVTNEQTARAPFQYKDRLSQVWRFPC